MAYNPDFSRNPKGKFKSNNNFVSIKNGSEAYLLEDELNEMQWIQNEQRSQMVRSLFKSGIPYKTLQLTNANVPENETICLKGFGNPDLVANAILFNIENYIPVNMNGYFLKLQGSYKKDVRGNNTNYNNILIKLPKEPTDVPRYDLVYLEAWFEEINVIDNKKIKDCGGQQNNNLDDFNIDDRINVETTRRIQLKWEIRTVDHAKVMTDLSVHPRGNRYNGNYVPANTILGENYSKDTNLFVSINNPGVVDKTYYAIPLFSIYRLVGKTTVDPDNCLNLLPMATLSSSAINGDLTIGGGGGSDTNNYISFIVNNNNQLNIKNEDGSYATINIRDLILHDNVDEKNNIILRNQAGGFEVRNVDTNNLVKVLCGSLSVKGDAVIGNNTITLNDSYISGGSIKNSGLSINRGTEKKSSLIWDETNDKWKAGLAGSEKTILLDDSPVVTSQFIVSSEYTNKIVLRSSGNKNNYIAVQDKDGKVISLLGFDGTYWYAGENKLAVVNKDGYITDSNGLTTQTKDFSILNTNTTFKCLSGDNQFEINKVLDSKIAVLEKDSNKVKIFSQTTDPGTASKTNDLWIDLTNNVIKTRLSNGTWKMLGAAYN